MKKRTRRLPKDRREQMLKAALALARKQGYTNVSRAAIAARCSVSEALLSHYFGTMTAFRRALMRYAVQQGDTLVVLQGLVDGNSYAHKAPKELRDKALGVVAA